MEKAEAVEIFTGLAQETRLGVYELLVQAGASGLPAGDISTALGVPQNTLSFHLSHLEKAGLVLSRRAGRYIIYRAQENRMKDLLRYMITHCCAPEGRSPGKSA